MPAYANFIGTVNYFSRNVTVELQYDGLVKTKSPLHRTLVFARANVWNRTPIPGNSPT